MMAAIDRADGTGAWLNVALTVAAVLIGNAVIFATGISGNAALPPDQAAMVPPGPVVGGVWVLLFALMGLARWLWLRGTGDRGGRSWLPPALAVLCLAFPVYTAGFDDPQAGAVGTLATLAATVAIQFALRRAPAAAWALVPTAGWLGYVACVYCFV